MSGGENRCLNLFGSGDPQNRVPWDTTQIRSSGTAKLDGSVVFSGNIEPSVSQTNEDSGSSDDQINEDFAPSRRPSPGPCGKLGGTSAGWCAPDLSEYNAFVIDIKKSDGLEYTIVLEDVLESSVTWQHNFSTVKDTGGRRVLHFRDFKPFDQGKVVPSPPPLDWSKMRSFRFWVRSFSGRQTGPFCLELYSVVAYKYQATPALLQLKDPLEVKKEGKESRLSKLFSKPSYLGRKK